MSTGISQKSSEAGWWLPLAAISLVLFSWFSGQSLVLALLCLLAAQGAILVSIWPVPAGEIFRGTGFQRVRFSAWWLALPIVTAVLFAVVYRKSLLQPALPSTLSSFALIAVMIGAVEEMVYRGYFTWKLNRCHWLGIIAATALAHTCYKTALFYATPGIDLLSLSGWTFVVGLLLGGMRIVFNSIYPCLVFHCLFDLLVYGDRLSAPWWVW